MVKAPNVVEFAPFLEARRRELEQLPLLAVAEGHGPSDVASVSTLVAPGRPLSEREVAHRARMLQHLRSGRRG